MYSQKLQVHGLFIFVSGRRDQQGVSQDTSLGDEPCVFLRIGYRSKPRVQIKSKQHNYYVEFPRSK